MSKSNEIINFYEHSSMKKLVKTYHNPHFNDTQMTIPARIGVIAPSGTGKTIWLLNYISKCSDTFGKIIICYKASEPLYELLREKIGKNIIFYSKLVDLPLPKDLDCGNKQVLLVFDDYIVEKNQEKICEYFIRGRKCCGGVTIAYLSQNYFSIPQIIRRQFNYLIILKLSGAKDLNLILRNYSLGLDIKEITDIYKDATKIKFEFLKVNCETADENKKFSKNWNLFYKVTSDNDED